MPVNPLDFAVVVGINHYPEFRSLEGAVNDAGRFANWLTDQDKGGGLPRDNCKLVLSNPEPLKPEHKDIDQVLEQIFDMVGDGPARRFYFYFSGHGVAETQTRSHLCLAGWAERRNLALDAHDYMEAVAAAGIFKEIVFLTDCCRVRIPQARGLPCTIARPMPDHRPETRTFQAYAAEVFTQAFEANDGRGEKAGNFTRVLLDGLYGAASRNGDGVTPTELKEYLETYVPRVSEARQRSEVVNSLNSDARFGAAGPRAVDVSIRFTPGRVSEIVLLDPNWNEIKRGLPDPQGWEVKLRCGMYMLQEAGTQHEETIAVRPGAGELHVDF